MQGTAARLRIDCTVEGCVPSLSLFVVFLPLYLLNLQTRTKADPIGEKPPLPGMLPRPPQGGWLCFCSVETCAPTSPRRCVMIREALFFFQGVSLRMKRNYTPSGIELSTGIDHSLFTQRLIEIARKLFLCASSGRFRALFPLRGDTSISWS